MPLTKKLNTEITNADIESLRKRFQLVEGDRKAYFETYEQTKRQNDDRIRELRVANQELRNRVAEKKRRRRGGGASSDGEMETSSRELHRLRSSYDKLRHESERMREQLTRMEDNLEDLERQSEISGQSVQTRQIRALENRLDKAMIKYNEAQSIKTTYLQIVKRLKDERVGFDNQLSAIERTLEAKRSDHEELLLLSGEAKHARDVAHREFELSKKAYDESCRRRELELKDREFVVKQRREMQKRVDERRGDRDDVVAKVAAKLNVEDEEKLRKSLLVNKVRKTQAEEEMASVKSKLSTYENAFRRIKEATGVSDVYEVLQKVSTQDTTCSNLQKLSKTNQEKLDTLREEQKNVSARIEELKYSGPSNHAGTRKIVDDLEDKCTETSSLRDANRQKYERVQRVLLESHSGIEHLFAKVEHISVSGLNEDARTILDVLYNCETVLSELQRKVESSKIDTIEDVTSEIKESDISATRPFNRRVEPEVMTSSQRTGDTPGDVEEVDERVTREQMKVAARECVIHHTETMESRGKKKSSGASRVDEEAMTRKTRLSGSTGGRPAPA